MPDAESQAGLIAPNQTQQKEHAMPETITSDPAYGAIESVLNAHAGTTTGPDKEHVWCRPECGWVGHDYLQHRAHVAGALAAAGITFRLGVSDRGDASVGEPASTLDDPDGPPQPDWTPYLHDEWRAVMRAQRAYVAGLAELQATCEHPTVLRHEGTHGHIVRVCEGCGYHESVRWDSPFGYRDQRLLGRAYEATRNQVNAALPKVTEVGR